MYLSTPLTIKDLLPMDSSHLISITHLWAMPHLQNMVLNAVL